MRSNENTSGAIPGRINAIPGLLDSGWGKKGTPREGCVALHSSTLSPTATETPMSLNSLTTNSTSVASSSSS